MRFLAMKFLTLLLLSFPALAGEIVLENNYVRVMRDAAPCAPAHVTECADRVIVALGDIELASDGARSSGRGNHTNRRTVDLFLKCR
jgi:hypothetical protein